MNRLLIVPILVVLWIAGLPLKAQTGATSYDIVSLTVEGASDEAHVREIIADAGLEEGKRFRLLSDDLGRVIKRLWAVKTFSDVQVYVDSLDEIHSQAWVRVVVREGKRLKGIRMQGLPRGWTKKIKEKLPLRIGEVVTDATRFAFRKAIADYLRDKGFDHAEISVQQVQEKDGIVLVAIVDRGPRMRVRSIDFEGNTVFSDAKLRRIMRETKTYRWWNIFRKALFDPFKWEEDKAAVAQLYFSHGYRDFRIVRDSVVAGPDGYHLKVWLHEGPVYTIHQVHWMGNSKVSTRTLRTTLGIDSGDVYDKPLLERRLYFDPMGFDVSSLYMNDGYLFFQLKYNETFIDSNRVDIEIRIQEGPRVIVNRNMIAGNVTTHDHVILRELRTRPGSWFQRSAVVRSQRELAQMGFFSPEKMEVVPHPRPEEGIVDIEYKVEEVSTDKIELSGSWYQGLYLTLGVQLSNFSLQKARKWSNWRPYPAGDAQRVAVRVQTNGPQYASANFSFADPWFGGHKPNAFSFSSFYTLYMPGRYRYTDPVRQRLRMYGGTVSLSKRLRWPDDYFVLHTSLGFTRYRLDPFYVMKDLDSGLVRNLNFSTTIVRSSVDQPIYPQHGGKVSLAVTVTPPYSLLSKRDYSQLSVAERFKWMEYHKWRVTVAWFQAIVEKLVVAPRLELGLIGAYNPAVGIIPFERFVVGGSGLSGYGNFVIGKEPIALRGYGDETLTPRDEALGISGASSYLKYTMELRYPLTLSPSMSAYVLGFVEAGNAWLHPRQINPFDVYRGAGLGVRIFMPMFGLMGVDWGYGFDPVPGNPTAHGSNFHFVIGQRF